MHSRAKQVSYLFLPALLLGMLLLPACENDLNKIKAISAKLASLPIDTTRGVDIIYSDSAKVKAQMTTPLLIEYNTNDALKSYRVMPKGVKVIFYDKQQQETINIVSDSAIQRDKEKLIEFHKNVVATNAKGETFASDELIWDQGQKKLYSHKPVKMTTPTGEFMNGVNFESDDKLEHQKFGQATGVFSVSDTSLQ